MAAFDWDDVSPYFTADWVETATYSGTGYNVIRYKQDLQQSVIDAGDSDRVDFMLMAKVADFTPTVESEITFDSTIYVIDKVSKDSTGKTWLITLRERYA